MIATNLIHVAPQPVADVVYGGVLLGFHQVMQPVPDRDMCSECGRLAPDYGRTVCRRSGCPLFHARANGR